MIMSTNRRPKRLIIPTVQEDILNAASAYEWDWVSFYESTNSRRRRPFPSSSVLASLPRNYTATDITLLQNDQLPDKQVEDDHKAPKEDDALFVGDTIDRLSTLTAGQHKRYLQLQQDNKRSWNEMRRKEWNKLRVLVEREQDLYTTALRQFFVNHRERFMVGFQRTNPSPFASWHSDYVQRYVKQWNSSSETYTKFGKCRQVASLVRAQMELTDASPNELYDFIKVESTAEAVSVECPIHVPVREGDVISPLHPPTVPAFLVDKSAEAILLAKEHGASIVTTDETLRVLIEGKNWRIPMTKKSGCIILDIPLPCTSTTRECLTKGMHDAINKTSSTTQVYTHTLLTIKTKRLPHRILVRVKESIGQTTHVHLEYFHERGWEKLTAQERACWILDYLFGLQSEVARICPKTSTVLKVDPGGVAHALAHDQEPMRHLQVMNELLMATESMPDGNLLLVRNGSDVRVHSANDGEPAIDLENDFVHLDAVYTGFAALDECALPWEWNRDGVPNTFPTGTNV